jgi:hypothetical protein
LKYVFPSEIGFYKKLYISGKDWIIKATLLCIIDQSGYGVPQWDIGFLSGGVT